MTLREVQIFLFLIHCRSEIHLHVLVRYIVISQQNAMKDAAHRNPIAEKCLG